MTYKLSTQSDVLDYLVEQLDIPRSYYEKAAARHRSLGEWLLRDASSVKDFDPDIRPQGSFRFGTVIRPLDENEEYDLDSVCVLKRLSKTDLTQQRLKEMYGFEIQEYARAHNMLKPVEECKRCWRLRYSDEVSFHLDTLPCVPEEQELIAMIVQHGTDPELARRCVAITDTRDENYQKISQLWPSSNPRGFARWFELRCELGRSSNSQYSVRATIEDVPPYEWKTTLQRSIQILKRHRDVMFKNNGELAPISMIITNLAARSYTGETDLLQAITTIVNGMESHVRSVAPFVPNPANPAEDYADKWRSKPELRDSFFSWLYAVKNDLRRLPIWLADNSIKSKVQNIFEVTIPLDRIETRPAPPQSKPSIYMPTASKPWSTIQ